MSTRYLWIELIWNSLSHSSLLNVALVSARLSNLNNGVCSWVVIKTTLISRLLLMNLILTWCHQRSIPKTYRLNNYPILLHKVINVIKKHCLKILNTHTITNKKQPASYRVKYGSHRVLEFIAKLLFPTYFHTKFRVHPVEQDASLDTAL